MIVLSRQSPPIRLGHATSDCADRLRRSLKRLGYELVDAERGNF